jgi:hypothetical protein
MDINENMSIDSNIAAAAVEGEVVQSVENSVEGYKPGFQVPEILKAKTGAGSVEDYMQHPLNFAKDMGLARVIRGATGILGALDLAIIDICVGLLEFFKGRKKVSPDVQ